MTTSLNFNLFSWENIDDYTNLSNKLDIDKHTEYNHNSDNIKEKLSYPSLNPQKNLFIVSDSNFQKIGYLLLIEEKIIDRAIVEIKILKNYQNDYVQSEFIKKAIELTKLLSIKYLNIQIHESDNLMQISLKNYKFKKIKTYFNMQLISLSNINSKLPNGLYFSEFRLNKDEKVLTNLQNTIFKNSWGFCPNTIEEIYYKVRMKNSNPNGIILIKNNYEHIGYVWTTKENKFGKISMTGIIPKFRSLGIGNKLISKGIEYLFNNKYSIVNLEVDSENLNAVQLYKKIGFNKFSEILWYEKKLIS